MSRLSLKRDCCNESDDSMDNVSDDNIIDLTSSEYECTDIKRHQTVILNNQKDASVIKPVIDTCCSKYLHDISDDFSSEEEVNCASTSKARESMFTWNKSARIVKPEYESNIAKDETLPEFHTKPKEKLHDELQYGKRKRMSNSDDSIEEVTIFKVEMIAGVKVKFPHKPYPCQKAVMNKLIMGCSKEENCLLESPTGSGKTLALLCGALAWQEDYSEKISREREAMEIDGSQTNIDADCLTSDENDDNFLLNASQYFDDDQHDKLFYNTKDLRKVPKIYYGTRTHKQIEQVIRELKKTAYKYKRMTILSSRERTCIQHTEENKTQLCHDLLDPLKGTGCRYFNKLNKRNISSFDSLKNYGFETPWDIEDLVSLGEGIGICPYFAARSLMEDAEIIFCPYNYIVNPDIRENMKISLKNNIVILDEAHNIEDICREVAGVDLRDDHLKKAAKDCQKFKKQSNSKTIYDIISEYLLDIVTFLQEINIKDKEDNWEQMSSDCWKGNEFLELLNINNLGGERFVDFLTASKKAVEDFELIINKVKEPVTKDGKPIPIINREIKRILEYLCFGIQMITSEKLAGDYRVYIVESLEYIASDEYEYELYPKQNYEQQKTKQRIRTLKMICMNPSIVFMPLSRMARTVILASGTLTPTTSFESELGTQFPHMLNANHVVPKEQVYVRCIPRGPRGKTLLATFKNVNSFEFQDELGNFILQVCDVVPYGVLCFFSSYNVMSKLHDRWKNNDTLKKLEELKEIFIEPRGTSKLPQIMKKYRSAIEQSSGAILFAVFRGKVAEGIDFSNNEARCVLAVGIPYSNRNDMDTSMKMQYNDDNISKGLLRGSEWYKVNAFRALNQGLGRCIRHIHDWGAVLLVDERLQKPENVAYLPKWIKRSQVDDIHYDLQTELKDFVEKQTIREENRMSLSYTN